MTQTNDGEFEMGISKIRFAALSCVGILALAATASAQFQSASYATPTSPAPVIYQDAGVVSGGCSACEAAPAMTYSPYQSVFSAPAASGCSSCAGGLRSRLAARPCGCGVGSRLGSGCGGGGLLGDCNLGDQWKLFGSACDEPRLNIGGWFQGGYHTANNGLFNSDPDRLNLHQAWFFAEKVATPRDNGGLGFGWRFDGMYGTDANDTQSFGNNPGIFDNGGSFARGGGYGWAIPQLYGEVAGQNWSAKVGHFYTLVGYEVVTAPDNFFYSHAMTMYNSEPFTHTGAIGTFNLSDDLTVYAGWTLGWDTGFDQFANGSSFMGGFSAPVSDASTLTYITTIGDFGARGSDAYSHSIVMDTAVTDNFNYVLQSDLVRIGSTGEDNVGLNQYFLYSINDCLGVGSRLEWWKGDSLTGYAPHGGVLPASGSHSYYGATFGLNYKPHANIIVRPEYRVDWSPALGYEEGYFGVDMIALY
jgi:hypothetical protein